jgi:hypothetical protein
MEPQHAAEAAKVSREMVELLAELGFRRVSELVSVETVETTEVSKIVLRLSPADAQTLLGLLRKGGFNEHQPAWSE